MNFFGNLCRATLLVANVAGKSVTFGAFEKALPEIPPVLPFSKGGELWGIRWRIPSAFSPIGKGKL
jgi:hypothetical protein